MLFLNVQQILAYITLLLLLASCSSTLRDVREEEPSKTGLFAIEPLPLAYCVEWTVGQQPSPLSYQLIQDPLIHQASLFARKKDDVSPEPWVPFELTFRHLSPSSTLVELREGYPRSDEEGKSWAAPAWQAVEQCPETIKGDKSRREGR